MKKMMTLALCLLTANAFSNTASVVRENRFVHKHFLGIADYSRAIKSVDRDVLFPATRVYFKKSNIPAAGENKDVFNVLVHEYQRFLQMAALFALGAKNKLGPLYGLTTITERMALYRALP